MCGFCYLVPDDNCTGSLKILETGACWDYVGQCRRRLHAHCPLVAGTTFGLPNRPKPAPTPALERLSQGKEHVGVATVAYSD